MVALGFSPGQIRRPPAAGGPSTRSFLDGWCRKPLWFGPVSALFALFNTAVFTANDSAEGIALL